MLVIITTLAATLTIQLGYFLWKISVDALPPSGADSSSGGIKSLLTNPRWLAGLLCTTLGWILFIKASDIGEISVIQPLMSVGDLFLVLLAVVFLHERLNKDEWIGLALTVAGAITLSLDARTAPPLGIDWVRLAILVACVIPVGIALYILGQRGKSPEIPLAIVVGLGFGMGAVLTELMTAYLTLGGQVLESSAFILNPILPFMIAANAIGLVLLQVAFRRGRAAVIVPVQLSVVNGVVVLSGIVIFSETITLFRLMAIAIIVLGTAWLQRGESKHVA